MSWVMVGIAAVNLTMAGVKAVSAHKSKKEQEDLAAAEKIRTDKLMTQYGEMDTSNPFENMTNTFTGLENTMEDLTVNQKQAQFQAQQNQQSQANILGGLRGAAGGSGIAALAQTMAQQGQLSAQQSSASIGKQEAMNQRMSAQQAGRLQTSEAQQGYNIQALRGQGARATQRMEMDKISTQLGMSQSAQQAHNENVNMYQQQTMDNIQEGANSAVTMAGGIYGGVGGGGGGVTPVTHATNSNGVNYSSYIS